MFLVEETLFLVNGVGYAFGSHLRCGSEQEYVLGHSEKVQRPYALDELNELTDSLPDFIQV